MRRSLYALSLAALLPTGLLRAADVDPNLPNDSEIVISVNVTQLLESQLGKRFLAPGLEQAFKENVQLQEAMKEVGLNPLKDISRITLATFAATPDEGLMIVNGKFNREKFGEATAKLAANHKDKLKIHKSSGQAIYEMIDDYQKASFLAFASDTVLLRSTSKEQISDVLARSKVGSPKKELAELIKKAEPKQTAWLAALPSVTAAAGGFVQPDQKAALDNLEGISGQLRIDSNAKLELSFLNKDAQSATTMQKMLTDLLNLGKLFLPAQVKEKPELQPVVDLLNVIRVATKAKTVTMSVEMTGTQIENLVKQQKSKDK